MLETVVLVALSLAAEERSVRSLFQENGRTEVTAAGLTVIRAPQIHVLVARVDEDGALSTACAATEDAVRALLTDEKEGAKQ